MVEIEANSRGNARNFPKELQWRKPWRIVERALEKSRSSCADLLGETPDLMR
jgi:hypothetical protein